MGYLLFLTLKSLSSRDITVFDGFKLRLVYIKGVDYLRPRVYITLPSYHMIVLKGLKPKLVDIETICCLRLHVYKTPQSSNTILC